MTDVNANGTIAQEVTLLDADGVAFSASNPIVIAEPRISVASAISGQVTVTTPGTSVQGGTVTLTNGVFVKALKGNTGLMYIGYATGDNRTGFELSSDQLIWVNVTNLNQLWFDASVGGEKVCWLKA